MGKLRLYLKSRACACALGLGLGQLPLERLDLAGLPNLELRGRLCLRWGNGRERGREADMVGERERA